MQVFGTDGVRDRAGEGYLAPGSVRHLGRAIASALEETARFPDDFPERRGDWIYVARDTRSSGVAIAEWIAEELRQGGYSVANLGVLPTPGAACVASVSPECCLALVISASHNPAEYNGIKLLGPTGAKISPDFETAVSRHYGAKPTPVDSVRRVSQKGSYKDFSFAAGDLYERFLISKRRRPERLRGRRVVLDTANGAAHEVAPRVFTALGMRVELIGASPDGNNINLNCGALHATQVSETVGRTADAALGFSFDGDADRMIPVTQVGTILDGDHVLAVAGRCLYREGRLPRKTVAATVMSNIGLEKALAAEDLILLRTSVGDRHVYRALLEGGHPLGGEQSGHVIFLEDARTGDGILAALRLLDCLETDDLDLESEAQVMVRYPQILRNVPVRERIPFDRIPAVVESVRAAERRLRDDGRVVLRYSGTEPLARVMVEGPSREITEDVCDSLCRTIERNLSA